MGYDNAVVTISGTPGETPMFWVLRGGEILSGPYLRRATAEDALEWHRRNPTHEGYPPFLGGQGQTNESVESSASGMFLIILACALIGVGALLL